MDNTTTLIVRVPASTSNLGPGFDTLGLALRLYDDYLIRVVGNEPSRVEGTARSAPLLTRGCPVMEMFESVYRTAGEEAPNVAVILRGEIPPGVGLGWSAAARVAGALAANHLLGNRFIKEQLLALLTKAEGHPDNVTPALYGGLTVSAQLKDGVLAHIHAMAAEWRLAVLAPDYTFSTEKARKALPKTVKLSDAVFNLQRVPLLVDALIAGDAEEVRRLLADRLHEAERAKNIKRYKKISGAAREAGATAVFISGAGPGVAALCLGEKAARAVAKAMQEATAGAQFKAETLVLAPEGEGARLAEGD